MSHKVFIPLSQQKVTTIDLEDWINVRKFKWCAYKKEKDLTFYATTAIPGIKRNSLLRLHTFICNPPPGFLVDHIDGNGLNNCRNNLRICSHSENARNRKKSLKTKSKYKGAYLQPENRWRATIKINDEALCLGCWDTEEEAAKAYNEAAIQLFGQFANLNIIK